MAKISDKLVFVGLVIASKADKDSLVICPYVKHVLIGSSYGGFCRSWLKCSLDFDHCSYRGKRVRVKFRLADGFHVVWVCPKVVGLPNFER